MCCGYEFAGRMLNQSAYPSDVEIKFSRPGKPTDNAFIAAFSARLWHRCLETSWVLSIAKSRTAAPVNRDGRRLAEQVKLVARTCNQMDRSFFRPMPGRSLGLPLIENCGTVSNHTCVLAITSA